MKKFDDHWLADDILLDTVNVQVVPDSTAAAGALRTGEVDLLLQTDPLTAEQFSDAAGFKVDRPNAAPFTSYLMINVADAPLDNKLVRQALAYAIDREKIAEIVYPGTAEPACEPWAPGHWAFDESLADACGFDLDKARDLLDEAGVGDFTVTVNTSDGYAPGSVAAAQIMKEDFAKIGVTLEIATYEPAKARELLLASDFQLLIHYYSEGGLDPQGMIPSGLWGPGEASRSNFTDAEYEAIAGRINDTLDQAERKKALSEFTAKVIEEAFLLPTVYTFRQYAMADGVDGLKISTAGFPILEGVTVG
jgi:peptide/nickel transport system substrate-binding protein